MSSVRVTYLQVSEGRRQLGCPEQVSWKVAQEVVLLLCPPHSDLDAKANSNASSISDSQNLIPRVREAVCKPQQQQQHHHHPLA